jgi:hypothetical protein
MSRTIILSLAAAATIAVASFASTASYARTAGGGVRFNGGGNHISSGARTGGTRVATNGGRLTPILGDPGRGHPGPGRPGLPGRGWAFHGHGHWIFREGRWIIVDGPVADVGPDLAPVAAPAPCTCLTKTYTPDGLVVFADICTKESASAPVNSSAADATPVPPDSQKN